MKIYDTLRQFQDNPHFPETLLNTCKEFGFNADALRQRPTITTSQAGDVKYDEDGVRVWLSRCTVEDGEPYDTKVTIALREMVPITPDDPYGEWQTLIEYPG